MVARPKPPSESVNWAGVRRRMATAIEAMESLSRLSPDRARKALESRSRTVTDRSNEDPLAVPLLIFELAGRRFALEARFTCEVVRIAHIAPLPGGPAHLAGLYDLRGRLAPVFNLRPLLGLPDSLTTPSWALACGKGQPELMLLVDMVEGVEGMRLDKLSPVKGDGQPWLRGAFETGVEFLDGEALLSDGDFFVGNGHDEARGT